MDPSPAAYQINANWLIVETSDEFCRLFQCPQSALLGRDVRTLLREDWRRDFRTYVAQALIGVGDCDATVPMVAPGGEASWFKHSLEPMLEDGRLHGYRATITALPTRPAALVTRWWRWRPAQPKMVWNFDPQQEVAPLAKAS